MQREHTELNDNDEIMRRCRRVRSELNRRFKTVDALCDYMARLQKESGTQRTAKRAPHRKATKRLAFPAANRTPSHTR